MRRFLILFILIILACQVVTPQVEPQSPSASLSPSADPSATPSQVPTSTPLHLPLPTSTLVPTPQPQGTFSARFHPDGNLYVSDVISLEILAPPDEEVENQEVQARVIDPISQDLGTAEFRPFGIGGRHQATMQWVWDTADLTPDDYTLEFSVLHEEFEWTETIALHPQSQLPSPQPEARWEVAETECCQLHYITGTDAARDLLALMIQTDEQAESAAQRLRTEFEDPVAVTLLSRVLGHGGFAGEEIYVSYLDRNYAGSNYTQVLHHEMIHILDNRLGGDFRPSIFVEGLAVYLTGGHYKAEPIFARAAAVLDLGWYIPLDRLSDDFYTSQHEIGYIQAAALVDFMVRNYGWEAFSDFYRQIQPPADGDQSQAIDSALQEHLGITFSQLEDRFLIALRRQPIIPDVRTDVRLTVTYYNTVRRYQQLMDPSAFFLTAWLPSGEQMRQRGIVADYLRHPSTPENISLENMLVQVYEHLHAGRYEQAVRIISAVNLTLSKLGDPAVDPLLAH